MHRAVLICHASRSSPQRVAPPIVGRSSYRKRSISAEEWQELRKQARHEEEERWRAMARHDLRAPERPRQPPVMLIDAWVVACMHAHTGHEPDRPLSCLEVAFTLS